MQTLLVKTATRCVISELWSCRCRVRWRDLSIGITGRLWRK